MEKWENPEGPKKPVMESKEYINLPRKATNL